MLPRSAAVVLAVCLAPASAGAYRLEDSLRGGTRGNPIGGAFEEGGWRVTARTDRIWYALPRLVEGSIELTISDMSLQNLTTPDNEILAMYEAGYGIAEPVRYAPEFRVNHYKAMLRIYGTEEPGRTGQQKLIWIMCPSGAPGYGSCGCDATHEEPFGGSSDWDGTPQRLRIEWGNGVTRYLRNGAVVHTIGWGGNSFGPAELHFSLGTSRPSAVDSAALPVGALFSDLVVEGTEGEVTTCPGPAVPDDDAAIDAYRLPTGLACGASFAASVTVRNTGGDTWSPGEGYRLGAVDDSDPLRSALRVDLPPALVMPPGATHTFEFELRAPAQPGAYTTDWRMVREHVHWFGAVARSTVAVTCEAPRDAGTAADAGVRMDGGAPSVPDAGSPKPPDAGTTPDGAVTPQEGTPEAPGSRPDAGGCRSMPSSGWGAVLVVAVLAAWMRRRREIHGQ